MRIPLLRSLINWGGFPYIFQILTLALFVWLAAIGWGLHTPPDVNAKLYAKSNLVTLLIWGLWWPAMVWSAVWFGRVWCMVCPLELVANVSERLGRRLGIRQRVLRPWMAAGVMMVIAYALLQLLVAAAQLHRTPAYTAWFLFVLLAVALATGLMFRDRAFCRGFCPVGLLLGTYGRGGMLAVRAGPAAACNACMGRDCVKARNRIRSDARSCPSLLNPPELRTNANCLVCGQCLKACQPQNMRLLLRWFFSKSDARDRLASWPVTVFVMLVSGFVTLELCTEWKKAEAVFLAAPRWVVSEIGAAEAMAGFFKWAWALLIVPGIVWLSLAGLARLLGEKRNIGEVWRMLALPMAVVIAAGHMSKGLAKFVSWAPYLPNAVRDPTGVVTAEAITAKTMAAPTALLTPAGVAVVGVGLMMGALWFAIREVRLAQPAVRLRFGVVLPLVIVAVVFAAIITGWAQH